MDFYKSMNISTSALTVNRLQLNMISANLANAHTTKTETGEPYRRKIVSIIAKPVEDFQSVLDTEVKDNDKDKFFGVNVDEIYEDQTDFRQVYNPAHPHANEEGYVLMPNVNTVLEMTNLVVAKRSYEANVAAMNAAKSMALKALEIGKT